MLLGTWTKALPFGPAASAQARLLVGDVLASWGLRHVAFAAQQCVSELVTDAVQHGSPPIHLVIKRWTDAVQVSVIDKNGRPPGNGGTTEYDEHWLRKRIVDGLVGGSGVEARSGGQAAWFDIALKRVP